jgi:hypothetical protein
MASRMQTLMQVALELADAVAFDMHGELIGGRLVGGNGGLLSDKTLAKADEVRRAVDAVRTVRRV